MASSTVTMTDLVIQTRTGLLSVLVKEVGSAAMLASRLEPSKDSRMVRPKGTGWAAPTALDWARLSVPPMGPSLVPWYRVPDLGPKSVPEKGFRRAIS